MIRIHGQTHTGGRKHNEDRFVADAGWGIALVSDGMGGAEAGEVAAGIVAAGMVDRLDAGVELVDAVVQTTEEVELAPGEGKGTPGMGATLVIAYFDGYDYQLSWIGDSRIYLWDGELRQLTRDHSKLEMLLENGDLTLEEAGDFPDKHMITRAMGLSQLTREEVPVLRSTLCRGQQLLLCSDGVTDVLAPAEIAAVLAAEAEPEETLAHLVDTVVAGPATDNITAVLVSADADAPEAGTVTPLPAVSVTRSDGSYHYYSAGEQAATT